MKKQMSLFVWAVVVFGMAPVHAEVNSGSYGASSADLTSAPGTRERVSVNYEKYETRSSTKTYDVKDGRDIYYAPPKKRSALYNDYQAAGKTESVRTVRAETARREEKRKYYLAHPFFQPLKGRFGSVTDVSYLTSSYDVAMTLLPGFSLNDTAANWGAGRVSIKEDLSYGITDRLAVLGMLEYNYSKYKMDWSLPATPDDEMTDSGVSLYGFGLQWRFADNAEWIATLSGYYQHQVDIANTFVADLKAGHKIGHSTIYGLARGWMVSLNGNSYGNGMSDGAGTTVFVAYNKDVGNVSYIEGGAGIFSVLDENWTLNLEAVFGSYDWHDQMSVKGALGWQPGKSFAFNLYAKASVYDSADGKDLGFWWLEPSIGINEFTSAGTVHVSNYSEMQFGMQAILYF